MSVLSLTYLLWDLTCEDINQGHEALEDTTQMFHDLNMGDIGVGLHQSHKQMFNHSIIRSLNVQVSMKQVLIHSRSTS